MCPLNLAPTSSAAATLVMGDALAITLMEMRSFESDDYAIFYPGGSLGRKLLTKVGDVMRSEDLPFISEGIENVELLIKISEGKLGMALIGSQNNLRGIITDGDFIREDITTSSGTFELIVPNQDEYYVTALNPNTGTNAIIFDRVTPSGILM